MQLASGATLVKCAGQTRQVKNSKVRCRLVLLSQTMAVWGLTDDSAPAGLAQAAHDTVWVSWTDLVVLSRASIRVQHHVCI